MDRRWRKALSARTLDDVPHAVRIGSPQDASDREVRKYAEVGALHPQTNYGVVYRVAFAPRLVPGEAPAHSMALRFMNGFGFFRDGDQDERAEGGWVLATTWGIRWHYAVDGVPGLGRQAAVFRPVGLRDVRFADIRDWEVREQVEFHPPDAPWMVQPVDEFKFEVDVEGKRFVQTLWIAPDRWTKQLRATIEDAVAS